MCVIACYNDSGKVEKYGWDSKKRVSSTILKKSGFSRLEIWVPKGTEDEMVKLGWFPALRSDGEKIVSKRGNQLFTFPERERLKPFPF